MYVFHHKEVVEGAAKEWSSNGLVESGSLPLVGPSSEGPLDTKGGPFVASHSRRVTEGHRDVNIRICLHQIPQLRPVFVQP